MIKTKNFPWLPGLWYFWPYGYDNDPGVISLWIRPVDNQLYFSTMDAPDTMYAEASARRRWPHAMYAPLMVADMDEDRPPHDLYPAVLAIQGWPEREGIYWFWGDADVLEPILVQAIDGGDRVWRGLEPYLRSDYPSCFYAPLGLPRRM